MAGWGNPETESFRRKHIREARAAGAVALVHAAIVSPAARLIEGLSDLHVEIPEQIPSYTEGGTEHQRLGLALHVAVPLPPPPDVVQLAERWGFDGFLVGEQVELRFTGDVERARLLTDEAIAAKMDTLDTVEVSGPTSRRWPGERDLEDGDTGPDVEFLRLVLGAGHYEPVDAGLREAVKRFQSRRGAPVNGVIDADLWRRIIPEKRPQIGAGESGFIVRVLQAALVAYEGSEHRVSGTWGVLTNRDVADLQKEYNLRVAQYVRAPEWAILLGPVNPRIEEARQRAKGVGVPNPAPEISTDAAVDAINEMVPTVGLLFDTIAESFKREIEIWQSQFDAAAAAAAEALPVPIDAVDAQDAEQARPVMLDETPEPEAHGDVATEQDEPAAESTAADESSPAPAKPVRKTAPKKPATPARKTAGAKPRASSAASKPQSP